MYSSNAGETHRQHPCESIADGRGGADAGRAVIMLAVEASVVRSRAQVSGGVRISPSLSERAGDEAAAGLVAVAREPGASIFNKVPAYSRICAGMSKSDVCSEACVLYTCVDYEQCTPHYYVWYDVNYP